MFKKTQIFDNFNYKIKLWRKMNGDKFGSDEENYSIVYPNSLKNAFEEPFITDDNEEMHKNSKDWRKETTTNGNQLTQSHTI